jgi:intraflagellar transport protein 172
MQRRYDYHFYNCVLTSTQLYLAVKEVDLAINMYKKNRAFTDMIRLVEQFRPSLLKETHRYLASSFEQEDNFSQAEEHYIAAEEWQGAVNMYKYVSQTVKSIRDNAALRVDRESEQWDDAIRIAKLHGGSAACKRVIVDILVALGPTKGMKVLNKHGLVVAAIDYCAESGDFELALQLAQAAMPMKTKDVHYKYALYLEDEEHYKEAEEEFIKANKAREAIDMYLHQQDWERALQVAEQHDPAAASDVYVQQVSSFANAPHCQ